MIYTASQSKVVIKIRFSSGKRNPHSGIDVSKQRTTIARGLNKAPREKEHSECKN